MTITCPSCGADLAVSVAVVDDANVDPGHEARAAAWADTVAEAQLREARNHDNGDI